MRYRWAKSSLRLLNRSVFQTILVLTFGLLVLNQQSYGQITTVPGNGGSASEAVLNGGGFFYYFVKYNGTPSGPDSPAFISGFTPLDVNVGQYEDNPDGNAAGSQPNMFEVIVSSNIVFTPSGTSRAAITIKATLPGGSSQANVPIAAVNGVPCGKTNNDSGNGQCVGLQTLGGVSHYYGALYPGNYQQVRVGFYPKDICIVSTGLATPEGCSGATGVNSPSDASLIPMRLIFTISSVVFNGPTSPIGTALDGPTQPTVFNFQTTTSTFSCPAQADLNNFYTPGDTEIIAHPYDPATGREYFGLGNTNAKSAPLGSIWIVGKEGVNPDISSSFKTTNTIRGAASSNRPTRIGGFTNAGSDTDRHSYILSFIPQDRAGIYFPPSSVDSCKLSNVQTGVISGLLPKDGCFIATAAFHSGEALPVQMLRGFRDRILLNSKLGAQFVQAYYRWSPGPAEWLSENPVFRLPVLMALAYVEALAWMGLNPWRLWLLLGFSSVALTGMLFILRKSWKETVRQR